jgi:hypothetical protein
MISFKVLYILISFKNFFFYITKIYIKKNSKQLKFVKCQIMINELLILLVSSNNKNFNKKTI